MGENTTYHSKDVLAKDVLVSVCICTYKRPHLAACLESIAQQELSEKVIINVVVVDNCPEHSAKAIVESFRQRHRIDVTYQANAAKNLSSVSELRFLRYTRPRKSPEQLSSIHDWAYCPD